MYQINNKRNNMYDDITNNRNPHVNLGFIPNCRITSTLDYDVKTNKRKLNRIKMKEIKREN